MNILDQLIPEAGAFYVMDRGYIDFARLYRFHRAGSFFVTRAKKDMDAQRRYSHSVDRTTGGIFDQTLVLHYQSAKDYPESLRGIRYKRFRDRQAAIVHHNLFEKTPLDAALKLTQAPCDLRSEGNQLILFD